MMSFDFVELAPISRLRSQNVCVWSWRLKDVMHVENLLPYMLPTGVQRRENVSGFSILLKHFLVSNK